MRAFLLPILCFLASCQTTGPNLTPPTYERVVAQFEATAFFPEFAARGEKPLRRWTVTPVSQLLGDIDRGAEFRDAFDSTIQEIAEIVVRTGSFALPAKNSRTTLTFAIMTRSEIEAAVGGPVSFRDRYGNSSCVVTTYSDPTEFRIFAAGIAIDRDLSPHLIRHCIAEETVQAMGLLGDACHYRPSLFCDYDEELAMTSADRILLRTLYDPRLKPGMSRAEAMPIARQIIRELWHE